MLLISSELLEGGEEEEEKLQNFVSRKKEEKRSKFQFEKLIEKGRRNNGTETKSLVRLLEDSTFEMLLR